MKENENNIQEQIAKLPEKPDKTPSEMNYLQDYGPSQEPIWRRGNRGTQLALELGCITEADITDQR